MVPQESRERKRTRGQKQSNRLCDEPDTLLSSPRGLSTRMSPKRRAEGLSRRRTDRATLLDAQRFLGVGPLPKRVDTRQAEQPRCEEPLAARRGAVRQELTRTLSLVIRILFSLISHSRFGLIVSSVGGADLQARPNFPTCARALAGSKVGATNTPRSPAFPRQGSPPPAGREERLTAQARKPARGEQAVLPECRLIWRTETRTPQPTPCPQRSVEGTADVQHTHSNREKAQPHKPLFWDIAESRYFNKKGTGNLELLQSNLQRKQRKRRRVPRGT